MLRRKHTTPEKVPHLPENIMGMGLANESFGCPQTQTLLSYYQLLTCRGAKIQRRDPKDQPLNGADRHSAEDNCLKVIHRDTVVHHLLMWSRCMPFGSRLSRYKCMRMCA